MATTAPANGTPDAAAMRAQNMAARQLITQNSVDLIQNIFQTTISNYTAGQAYPINVPVRNVGLIKRFWVEIVANVAQGAAETQTKTTLGGANALSQVVLTDLNNQVRVQTSGWHLSMLTAMKHQWGNVRAILASALIDEDRKSTRLNSSH